VWLTFFFFFLPRLYLFLSDAPSSHLNLRRYPVTREEYFDYLLQTKYLPQDLRGFLTGWNWSAATNAFTYPKNTGSLPVTSISLTEARKYCIDVGKRLPHTYEWQYAAQGNDGRKYPWGDEDDEKAYPARQHPTNGTIEHWTGPSPVDAHDGVGDSPFGVSDLLGNVWQWTNSEFRDEHTRRVIVRGTSSFLPRMANVYPAPLMIADWCV
jgi:formylglycine-generating enzyme required for sulfatase activity